MNSSLLELLWQALAIAFSAFGGAWCAFLFERRKGRQEESARRYTALRYCHMALLNQYTSLVNLRKQRGVASENVPGHWLTLLPSWTSFDVRRLDISGLIFTITESSDPDLLNRLIVTEQQFFAVAHVAQRRDQLHLRLQDRLAELRNEGHLGRELTLGEIEAAIGPPLVPQLKSLTEQLLSMLNEVPDGQKRRLEELASTTRAMFPDLPVPRHELL